MQEDIDLFCWLVPELPPTGKRNSVQMGGGGGGVRVVSACLLVCVNKHETG